MDAGFFTQFLNGTFWMSTLATTGLGSIAAHVLLKILGKRTFKRWAEKTQYAAALFVLVGLVVIGFRYIAWSSAGGSAHYKPLFKAEMVQVVTGESAPEKAPTFTARLDVVNAGTKSVVKDVRCYVTPFGGVEVRGKFQIGEITLAGHDREPVKIQFADHLMSKAGVRPIDEGGRVLGWVPCVFPGVDSEAARRSGTVFRIELEDAFGTVWHVGHTVPFVQNP